MFEGYGWSWGVQNYCHAGSSVPEAHPYISSSPAVQHGRHLHSACRPGLLVLPSGMPFNSVFIDVLDINQDWALSLESRRDSKPSSLETWAHDVDRGISMTSFFDSYPHLLPLSLHLAAFRSLAPSFCVNFLSIMVIQLLLLPPLSSTFRVREVVGSNDRLSPRAELERWLGSTMHTYHYLSTSWCCFFFCSGNAGSTSA